MVSLKKLGLRDTPAAIEAAKHREQMKNRLWMVWMFLIFVLPLVFGLLLGIAQTITR